MEIIEKLIVLGYGRVWSFPDPVGMFGNLKVAHIYNSEYTLLWYNDVRLYITVYLRKGCMT